MSVLRVIKFLVRSISIVLHLTTIKSKISDTVPISYSDGHDPQSSEWYRVRYFRLATMLKLVKPTNRFRIV